MSGLLYTVIVLLDGGTIVMPPVTLNSTETMDVVDKYKVTGTHFFPSRLEALVREMRRTGRRLPSMKRIGIAGSVLSASAADTAREAFDGLECLLNVYVMTESCSIITAQPKTPGACTGGDIGVPNVTAKIKVVDFTTGKKLGPQEIGEIRFHIEGMTRGYYKRPKENLELFDEEGWCKSARPESSEETRASLSPRFPPCETDSIFGNYAPEQSITSPKPKGGRTPRFCAEANANNTEDKRHHFGAHC
ncbi:hypothetical protein HPB50_028425 [Hyalomma asiaticum]|nr:hypothetical protein HPB50_028425 [Hyalomma asiaticum]